MSNTIAKITIDGNSMTEDDSLAISVLEYIDNDCRHADDLQIIANEDIFKKDQVLSLAFPTTNYQSTQKAAVMNCGVFFVDSLKKGDIEGKYIVKASALKKAESSKKKCRAWEKINLKELSEQIAKENNMQLVYASEHNPVFRRKEQIYQTDISFLHGLCIERGLELKITNNAIVIFSPYEYGEKETVRTFESGEAEIDECTLHHKETDTAYGTCHMSYMDPVTAEKIEGYYTIDKEGKTLEINNKKATSTEEANLIAKYAIMEKNSKEYTGTIECEGDITLAAGAAIALKGYSEFDMKYIITKAVHRIKDNIYKTTIWFEKALEV